MRAQDFVFDMLPRTIVPLVLVNASVGAIAVAWVLGRGDWVLVLAAVLLLVPGVWLLRHLLDPARRLAAPLQRAAEEDRQFQVAFFAGLQTLYGFALVTLWCVSLFGLYLGAFRHTGSDLPVLLLAWASASAPWTHHASKETSDLRSTTLGALAAQIACVVLVVTIGAFRLPTEKAYFTLGGVMLLAFVGATLLVVGVWMEWIEGSEATDP